MFAIVALILLLIGNWLSTDFLVFIPIAILDNITHFINFSILFLGLLFLGWCMAEND